MAVTAGIITLYVVTPLLTLLGVGLTALLVHRHYAACCEPEARRLVVCVLLMVPVYGVCSCLSLFLPRQFLYLDIVKEAYEAFVLYQFYQLLVHLFARRAPFHFDETQRFGQADKCAISEEARDRQTDELFARCQPYVAPCHLATITPSAPLLWHIRLCVQQYLVLRLALPLVLVVLHNIGVYEHRQLTADAAYMWLTLGLCNLSMTVAVAAVFLLVALIKPVIAPHTPLLKFMAIKLILVFIFWQSLLFSLLAACDALPFWLFVPAWTPLQTTEALHSSLICFELAALALYHHWIFPYDEHQRTSMLGGSDVATE